MTGFITRRLASAVLLLFATSVVVFGIFEVIPSYNPARAIAGREATAATVAEISQKFGFDKPVWIQYGNTMKLIFTGQIIDYQDNLNVVSQFVHRFPVTLSLVVPAAIIWMVVAIVLFVALALFGQEVNGAKLWIRIGGAQFEPVEVIKLLVVLFMASYLAATGDVIARTRPWSLRSNAKYLGPLFIGWGVSMAILVFERDLGMATLLLATFAAMLYVATRRVDLIA
ncbi:MAG TPA: FtsW/RodA/SpoVE family cell cycle protein, partial [Trebonia sp.]|nr:FtsW/RodA/SpoVE family cell cycle protein [Trebonia sp.]